MGPEVAETGQQAASKLVESGILGALVVVLAIALAFSIWYFWRENKQDRKDHDAETKAKDAEIARLNLVIQQDQRDYRAEIGNVNASVHSSIQTLGTAAQLIQSLGKGG